MRHDWHPPEVDEDAEPTGQYLGMGVKMCFEIPTRFRVARRQVIIEHPPTTSIAFSTVVMAARAAIVLRMKMRGAYMTIPGRARKNGL